MGKNGVELKQVEPLRNLGFWTIWALGVGSVVGDGIFLLLGEGIRVAGPSAIFAFLVAGIIQMFMMAGMGELSVGMPHAGAMSNWVERIFGRWWGFLSGFGFALGWVITGGTTGLALGRMTCWFFPSIDLTVGTIIFAIAWLTIFAGLNIIGTAIAAKTQLYMVLALVGIMVFFGVVGVKDINLANFSDMMPFGWAGFFAAIPMGTYAYMGAITLATAGGECRNPRDMPKALIWSSVTFLLVYTLCQFVVLGVIPWNQITMDVSPFTVAAGAIFGKSGAAIINLAGVIAGATTILMGTIYAPSRIFYDQAKSGLLPKWFGFIHPKTRTPINGIIAVWAISIVLILSSLINADFLYVTLSLQLVLAWCISWALALVAAIVYRKKYMHEIEQAGWKQPLFPLFPVLGLLGIGLVVWFTFASSIVQLISSVVWIGALAIYYIFHERQNRFEAERIQTASIEATEEA